MEAERSMMFYHVARVDGLEKRVETPTQMTEYFINRDDFLIYRLVEFAGREKKFGPSEATSERTIIVIIIIIIIINNNNNVFNAILLHDSLPAPDCTD